MTTPISVADTGHFADTFLNGKPVALTDSASFTDRLVNGSGDYAAQVLADGPVAWWRLDELSGTVLADSSLGGHNLDIASGPFTFGQPAAGRQLSGTSITGTGSTYAVYSPSTAWVDTLVTSSFSIEFWIKTGSSTQTLMHKGNGTSSSNETFQLYTSGGQLSLDYTYLTFNQTTVTGPNVNDNQWHHNVITYRNLTEWKWYIDNHLVVTQPAGTNPIQNTALSAFTLGAVFSGGYSGKLTATTSLDEVAIYPLVLTADRVQGHYLAATAAPYRVGPASTANLSGVTLSPAMPQVATAGNILLAQVGVDADVNVMATCTTPSGWTLANSFAPPADPSNRTMGLFMFVKTAVGGDSPPVFTVNGIDAVCGLEEWANVGGAPRFLSPGNNGFSSTNSTIDQGLGDLVLLTAVTDYLTGVVVAGPNQGYHSYTHGTGLHAAIVANDYLALTAAAGTAISSSFYGSFPATISGLTLPGLGYPLLTDSATFTDTLVITTITIDLEETGSFGDSFAVHIPGGPIIMGSFDDIDGATEIDASYAIDGIPVLFLDFIDGATDVEMSYIGPIYTLLDPIDGSTDIHLGYRARLFAYPDPVDGASDVQLTLTPSDPAQNPLGVAGLQLNTPIGIAFTLTGSLALIPPVATG